MWYVYLRFYHIARPVSHDHEARRPLLGQARFALALDQVRRSGLKRPPEIPVLLTRFVTTGRRQQTNPAMLEIAKNVRKAPTADTSLPASRKAKLVRDNLKTREQPHSACIRRWTQWLPLSAVNERIVEQAVMPSWH